MTSGGAREARLEADLAEARRRWDTLQQRWGVAKHTSSSTDDPDDLDVELAQVEATIAELQEQLAGTGAEPAQQSSSLPRAPSAVDLGAPPANDVPQTVREYLSTKQAAALLGCSVKHLETLRSRREGPPFVRLGKAVRYPRATLALPKK